MKKRVEELRNCRVRQSDALPIFSTISTIEFARKQMVTLIDLLEYYPERVPSTWLKRDI